MLSSAPFCPLAPRGDLPLPKILTCAASEVFIFDLAYHHGLAAFLQRWNVCDLGLQLFLHYISFGFNDGSIERLGSTSRVQLVSTEKLDK